MCVHACVHACVCVCVFLLVISIGDRMSCNFLDSLNPVNIIRFVLWIQSSEKHSPNTRLSYIGYSLLQLGETNLHVASQQAKALAGL